MNNFNSIDEILDFAIKAEQEAVDFYTDLSKQSVNNEMKLVFEEFAMEEVKHKARLTKIKEEGIFEMKFENIADLKISDYTVKLQPYPDMSYQDALILAMNREKAAFKLYTKLSTKTDNPELKTIFLSLAQEESKHKLRFELEYDEYILREN
jgi:rubrerythrin